MPSSLRLACRVAVVGALAALALFTGLAGCGSGAQCALDNDCPLGQRCSADNQCIARGPSDLDAAVAEERDAGPRLDAGPDAPVVVDAFAADVPMDAPLPVDAPRDDANEDANADAFDGCTVLAPRYTISRVGLTCMSMAATVQFERLPALCAYEVSSDRVGDVEGVMTFGAGSFSGGLAFPDMTRPCTLDLSVLPAVVIACGSCTLELAPL